MDNFEALTKIIRLLLWDVLAPSVLFWFMWYGMRMMITLNKVLCQHYGGYGKVVRTMKSVNVGCIDELHYYEFECPHCKKDVQTNHRPMPNDKMKCDWLDCSKPFEIVK